MLTFGASRCSSRLTAGTRNGPMAAGVRSMSRLPYGSSFAALARCALADVASKTIPMSEKFGSAIKPSTPSCVVGTPRRAGQAVGLRVDADHGTHAQVLRVSHHLDHQIGADVAGTDDRDWRLVHPR